MGTESLVRVVEQWLEEIKELVAEQRPREWLNVQQAADVAGVDRSVIDRAVKSGELAASNVGSGKYRILRIERAAIDEWLESRRIRTAASMSKENVLARHYPNRRSA